VDCVVPVLNSYAPVSQAPLDGLAFTVVPGQLTVWLVELYEQAVPVPEHSAGSVVHELVRLAPAPTVEFVAKVGA